MSDQFIYDMQRVAREYRHHNFPPESVIARDEAALADRLLRYAEADGDALVEASRALQPTPCCSGKYFCSYHEGFRDGIDVLLEGL